MIEKQLKIGDHIVDASGHIYVIEAINKASYRAKRADGCYGSQTIPFNGMQRWYSDVREYFVCDDVQLKIIENLGKENRELQQKLKEMERDINIAKNLKENIEWLCQNKLSDLEFKDDDQGGKTMKPKIFSERTTFTIKKDEVGGVRSTIEEKHFKSKWEALDYCKKRMEEIREQERKEAKDIGYDVFNQFVGITSDFFPKKDDLFDYFVSMGGCKRIYTFSVMREVYLGRLGWNSRKYTCIPKDPKERNAIAKGLEVKE